MSVITKHGAMGSAGQIGAWLNQSNFGGSPEGALLFLNALEMNRANDRIQETLNAVKASAKLRNYLNKRLAKLNDLKAWLQRNGGEKDPKMADVQAFLKEKYNLPPSPIEKLPESIQKTIKEAAKQDAKQGQFSSPLAEQYAKWEETYNAKYNQLVDDYGLTKDNVTVDAKTGRLNIEFTGENLISDKIKSEDLEAEINRLEGEANTADQNRQLQLTMTQTALNQKQQLLTLMTNVIKKDHETKSAVLRNLA